MVDRVLLQSGSGGQPFRFRFTKPGKDINSTNPLDFVLHEGLGTVAPYIYGTITVGANSNSLVNFGRVYAEPALIMLKPSGGLVAFMSQFEAKIQGDMSSMRIYNHTQSANSVTYYVYWNSIGDNI